MHMLLYSSAVFLSAFLLFLIQPMLTKALLPAFGGSYLVWGAAMVFFQAVLLGGYLCSHLLQGRFGARRYGFWHLLVLLVPFGMFPFQFEWQMDVLGTNLALAVFRQLFVVAGVPFLVLSMTSLVLQRWLMVSDLPQRRNPYVLYAASNAGSVSALLAYPLLIEPVSTLEQQASAWWIGYGLLVLLHLSLFPWRCTNESKLHQTAFSDVTWGQRLRWFLLSLASGTVLLGTTNVITFDIAAIPLLWVLPLALFMLAYVLVFKSSVWCPAWMERVLNWIMVLGGCMVLLMRLRIMPPPGAMLIFYLLILFVACINCNVWLLRLKPATGQGLTAFYVILATGGLCGSLLVSWVLPLVTHSLLEYPLGLLLCLVAVGAARPRQGMPRVVVGRAVWVWRGLSLCAVLLLPRLLPMGHPETFVFMWVALPLALGLRACKNAPFAAAAMLLALLVSSQGLDRFANGGEVVARLRNYYGIYHIYDRDGVRYLQHGTTQHGRQYLDAARREIPLAYYHPSTPVAQLLEVERTRIAHVGMIGLGTGAIAAYIHAGQQLTVFELDPDNLVLAEEHFGYLGQARAQGGTLQFVFGDGRLQLARQPSASFDLLIMDAFNSGSIPVHLLTVEALDAFMRTLRPDGILLLHLSNRVLDLLPVVYANAASLGWYAVEHSNQDRVHPDAEYTAWMAVSRDADRIEHLQTTLGWQDESGQRLPRPWTDRYSNLPAAIRWF